MDRQLLMETNTLTYQSDKIKQVRQLLKNVKQFVTFDFETNGQYKQYGGKIRCVGLSTNGQSIVLEASEPGFKEFMIEFLNSDVKKCAFNCVFEIRWCLDEFGIGPRNLIYDPMLMHYIIDENKKHGLEAIALEYLEKRSWKLDDMFEENNWDFESVPMNILMPYCEKDCKYTHELTYKLTEELKEQNLKGLYIDLLMPLACLCAKMEHRGMMIDRQWAQKISGNYETSKFSREKQMFALKEILDYVDEKRLEKNKFIFNLNSSKQIAEIVYKKLGLRSIIKTKKGSNSASEKALEPLRTKHVFIDLYLQWKQINTIINNYLEKYPKYQDDQGLIHSNFNPAFIVTGRLSCSNPSAQTIPNDPNVRGMFISRFKGGKVLSGDFDQLELRLIASESQDPTLLRAFKEGIDPHNLTAEKMFGKDFTQDQRRIAKAFNFGINYGLTEWGIMRNFNVSEDQAMQWLHQYRKTYPRLFEWIKEQYDFVKKNGYIKSKTGRIRHLNLKGMEEWKIGHALRQAGNFPIQSLGADITNITAIEIDKELKNKKFNSIIFNQIHDSLLIDLYPNEGEDIKVLCDRTINYYVQEYCTVPLTMTFKENERWGT